MTQTARAATTALVATALCLVWAASAAAEPNDTLVLDDARDVTWTGKDVRYTVTASCPSETVSTELTKRFEAAAWAVVEHDPLDPSGHGEHLRTWSVITRSPGEATAIWIGWFGTDDELANVVLMCAQPAAEHEPTDLGVTIRHLAKSDL